jgi:hypothetical protein
MKTFYSIILLTGLLFNSLSLSAQDSTKTKKITEYYISLANVSPLNVSIKYKRQLKNNLFFKVGLINLSVTENDNLPSISTSYPTHHLAISSGLLFGLEFRKAITDKFTFYHGINLSFSYSTSISKTDNPNLPLNERKTTSLSYSGAIPYTLGLLFQLNKHFFLSAEINPNITFTTGTNSINNNRTFASSLSLGTNYGVLSLVFRL